jgi:hypothetical protein
MSGETLRLARSVPHRSAWSHRTEVSSPTRSRAGDDRRLGERSALGATVRRCTQVIAAAPAESEEILCGRERLHVRNHPHPNPLPEYREREHGTFLNRFLLLRTPGRFLHPWRADIFEPRGEPGRSGNFVHLRHAAAASGGRDAGGAARAPQRGTPAVRDHSRM